MRELLLTGAGGYLGAHLAGHLAGAGWRVTAQCRTAPPAGHAWRDAVADVVTGDVRDAALYDALARRRFDAIVHLVSLDHHQSGGAPETVAAVNLLPVWRLVEGLPADHVPRLVYLSTIHVYGRIPPERISEGRPPTPGTPYGLTHWLSEEVVRFATRRGRVEGVNLRLSNGYGSPVFPGNACWSLVINDLCRTVVREGEIRLLSDGSPQRDFIHVNDVCRAVGAVLSAERLPGDTVHVASGKTHTILELARRVQAVWAARTGREAPIRLPEGVAESGDGMAPRYTIDVSRLETLGALPALDLEAGISELFDYLEGEGSA